MDPMDIQFKKRVHQFSKSFPEIRMNAYASANESKFWLGLLRDSGKAKRESVNVLLSEIKELANILASSILTLKGKRRR